MKKRGSYKKQSRRDEEKIDDTWNEAKRWIDLLLVKRYEAASKIFEQNKLAQDLYRHVYSFDDIHNFLWSREIRAGLRQARTCDLAHRGRPCDEASFRGSIGSMPWVYRVPERYLELAQEQLEAVSRDEYADAI